MRSENRGGIDKVWSEVGDNRGVSIGHLITDQKVSGLNPDGH
jgi:hypothetical protein